jgi:hypothetical protein
VFFEILILKDLVVSGHGGAGNKKAAAELPHSKRRMFTQAIWYHNLKKEQGEKVGSGQFEIPLPLGILNGQRYFNPPGRQRE